jgi:hypothetical protein
MNQKMILNNFRICQNYPTLRLVRDDAINNHDGSCIDVRKIFQVNQSPSHVEFLGFLLMMFCVSRRGLQKDFCENCNMHQSLGIKLHRFIYFSCHKNSTMNKNHRKSDKSWKRIEADWQYVQLWCQPKPLKHHNGKYENTRSVIVRGLKIFLFTSPWKIHFWMKNHVENYFFFCSAS